MAEYDMSGVVREKVDEKVTSRHSCSRARMHTLIYFGCDRSKAHIKQLANHALAKNNMGQQKKHDPSKVMPIFGSNPNLPKKKTHIPKSPRLSTSKLPQPSQYQAIGQSFRDLPALLTGYHGKDLA
jgi:hypothetical protein